MHAQIIATCIGVLIGALYIAIMEKLGGKAPIGYAIVRGVQAVCRTIKKSH
ncbi:MAG: hypothetical protein WC767_00250 [Candidatus Paceibacterota bacterium]|jgi:hypothetical protein